MRGSVSPLTGFVIVLAYVGPEEGLCTVDGGGGADGCGLFFGLVGVSQRFRISL